MCLNDFNIQQLSQLAISSIMLYDNKTMNQNKNSRTIKDDFFVNLEKTLTKYAQSEYIIPFKCAK
jgi:hypothetical protein